MSDKGTSEMEELARADSISISPELFEKIYLSPQNAVAGDLRKTFGNPTPLYEFTLHKFFPFVSCNRH